MTTTRRSRQERAITIRGGPTAVIDIGDLRIASDPTFDERGRGRREAVFHRVDQDEQADQAGDEHGTSDDVPRNNLQALASAGAGDLFPL
ncbi:hypothetical protein [Streptomyces sp. NPDC004721]